MRADMYPPQTPPVPRIAVAIAQGEARSPQVPPRPLGGHHLAHWHRPTRRRDPQSSGRVRGLPTRLQHVRLLRSPCSPSRTGDQYSRFSGPHTDATLHSRDDFYTALWNYLDCTASVFPVTHVDKVHDAPAAPHAFYNHEDEAMYKLCESLLNRFARRTSIIWYPVEGSFPYLVGPISAAARN